MYEMTFGMLGNPTLYPETAEVWQGFAGGLSQNDLSYYFVDDLKDINNINNCKINMLFTLNDQGLDKWNFILQNMTPLIVWGMRLPLHYTDVIEKLSTKQNFIFASQSKLDLSYFDQNCPALKKIYLPMAYDPTIWKDMNDQRIYDVVYVSSLSDVDSFMCDLESGLSSDAYQIICDIIKYFNRNPDASIYDIYCYLSLIYGYDISDISLYNDIYNKICGYLSDCKKLKVLKNIKGVKVNIWGSDLWKDYESENLVYMGQIDTKDIPQLYNQSKIVLNVDSMDMRLSLSSNSLKAMASGALLLTDSNLQMFKYFPNTDFDIYYNVDNSVKLSDKIHYYLQNYNERLILSQMMADMCKKYHTWKVRTKEFLSIFNWE